MFKKFTNWEIVSFVVHGYVECLADCTSYAYYFLPILNTSDAAVTHLSKTFYLFFRHIIKISTESHNDSEYLVEIQLADHPAAVETTVEWNPGVHFEINGDPAELWTGAIVRLNCVQT